MNELYKYGPYGEPKNVSNADSWTGSRFRYTGQTRLDGGQLYYYKARVYDPKMGRFLQTDPIGSKDDLNLYAYTAGDPINKTDPDGKKAKDWWDIMAKVDTAKAIATDELNKHPDSHNDLGDAERHSSWSKRMADETGPVFSTIVGLEHEAEGVVRAMVSEESDLNQTLKEVRMDMHNNTVGITASQLKTEIKKESLITSPPTKEEYKEIKDKKY